MKSRYLRFGHGFRVVFDQGDAQAAEMVLAPGDREGDEANAHQGADQWLFVVAGRGLAIVEGRRQRLTPGMLIVIERGERHEIRNTADTPLRTLNFYAPPAYRADETALRAGRPR